MVYIICLSFYIQKLVVLVFKFKYYFFSSYIFVFFDIYYAEGLFVIFY